MGSTTLDLEILQDLTEPSVALIVTVNENGDVLDARLAHIAEAAMILRGASEDSKPEEKEAATKTWWAPKEQKRRL